MSPVTYSDPPDDNEELYVVPWLFLIFQAYELAAPALRFALTGITEVSFGRAEERSLKWRKHERQPVIDVRLVDSRMSATHARLVRDGDGFRLLDCASTNGTLLDGERVKDAKLDDGAIFELGGSFFLLCWLPPSPVGGGNARGACDPTAPPGLQTLSPVLEFEFARYRTAAAGRLPLSIRGETGTGKELAALAAHGDSRRTGPFVAINCGSLASELTESELFGHRKGAFSGAGDHRKGAFRSADGGTLLLDEVAELRPSAQAALLRVLQEGEVHPVGDDARVSVDVRVVTATHADLPELVEQGRFRADLEARLSGYTLHLPPLRERRMDMGLIIQTMLRDGTVRGGLQIQLTCPAARALLRYDFPKNIRELARALEHGVVLSEGTLIDLQHLPDAIRRPKTQPAPPAGPKGKAPERDRLVDALQKNSGVVAAVARELGEHENQIRRLIIKHHLDVKSFRKP